MRHLSPLLPVKSSSHSTNAPRRPPSFPPSTAITLPLASVVVVAVVLYDDWTWKILSLLLLLLLGTSTLSSLVRPLCHRFLPHNHHLLSSSSTWNHSMMRRVISICVSRVASMCTMNSCCCCCCCCCCRCCCSCFW
ncbi:hypothetical protein BKA81DRAFT_191046 [Phyllosticta paracitricarpa]